MKFSIVVPSSGGDRRQMLARCTASIVTQMSAGDELLLSVDHSSPWGYRARQEMMQKATGDALLFMDDDDVYAPGALRTIRQKLALAPDSIHVFRMDPTNHPSVGTEYVWHTEGAIESGNVCSQILCIPTSLWLGAWGRRYEGDFDFFKSTIDLNPGVEVLWHEDVVCILRPEAL